ncbi:MAG: hypothetical protein OXI87_03835 [Albidovulum sp.]|nr:hypothetical protein [Albidovulum sp.]
MSHARWNTATPDSCSYPFEFKLDEDGRHVASFPDFGWGATDGAALDEALAEARDLLRELKACTMREARDFPEPSPPSERQRLVVPPVMIALKAALYDAFCEIGQSRRGQAHELGVAESKVDAC